MRAIVEALNMFIALRNLIVVKQFFFHRWIWSIVFRSERARKAQTI